MTFKAEYFEPEEFACKCGCGLNIIHNELVAKLDLIRKVMGYPIYVNSGCRCAKHNGEVLGKKHSYHLNGMAADITVPNLSFAMQAKLRNLLVLHFDGIIEYKSFYHVDIRGYAYRMFRED